MEITDILGNSQAFNNNSQKQDKNSASNEFATILESSQFTLDAAKNKPSIANNIKQNEVDNSENFKDVKTKTEDKPLKDNKSDNEEKSDIKSNRKSDENNKNAKENSEQRDVSENQKYESTENEEISSTNSDKKSSTVNEVNAENNSENNINEETKHKDEVIEEIVELLATSPELAQILQITPDMTTEEIVSAIAKALPQIEAALANMPSTGTNELQNNLSQVKDMISKIKDLSKDMETIPAQEFEEIISATKDLIKKVSNSPKNEQIQELAKFVKDGEKLEVKVENNTNKPVEAKVATDKVVSFENETETKKSIDLSSETTNKSNTNTSINVNKNDTNQQNVLVNNSNTTNNADLTNIANPAANAQNTNIDNASKQTGNINLAANVLSGDISGNRFDTSSKINAKTEVKTQQNILSKEVVEQVKVNITKSAIKGIDKISIELKPRELGTVEVKIEIGKDGKLKAEVIAQKAETLAILQKDVNTLEKAFNDAGFDTKDGSFTFNFKQNENNQQSQNQDNKALMSKILANGNREEITNLDDLNSYKTTNPNGGLNIRV